MKRMWAPWRIEYVREEKPEDCIFCTKPQETKDRDNLILFRGESSYVIMNRYPYNNGHLLVVPYAHIDTPTDLPAETLSEMMQQTNMCLEILEETMYPDGFNVGMNVGTAAGAGIKDHVHMHIVPRWAGDTNFMPVIGDIKVIVESCQECYERIKPLFDARKEANKT